MSGKIVQVGGNSSTLIKWWIEYNGNKEKVAKPLEGPQKMVKKSEWKTF